MSLFQQAAALNNTGVNALLQGDQSGAMVSLAESIKLMKHAISDASKRSAATSSTSSVGVNERIQELRTVEIPGMISLDDATIVFNQAILIPEGSDDPEEVDMDIYTVVVVFNLALIHNCKGVTASLVKAEKLYTMVIRLLEEADSADGHIPFVVKLASINNLAQIRYSKGDYKRALEDMSHMSSLIHDSTIHGAAQLLEEPKVAQLVMNAMFLQLPTAARAA